MKSFSNKRRRRILAHIDSQRKAYRSTFKFCQYDLHLSFRHYDIFQLRLRMMNLEMENALPHGLDHRKDAGQFLQLPSRTGPNLCVVHAPVARIPLRSESQ